MASKMAEADQGPLSKTTRGSENSFSEYFDSKTLSLRYLFLPGDDFPDRPSVYASTGGNQMKEDKPSTEESKQGELNDKTAMNDVAMSSSNLLFCYVLFP